MVKIAQFRPFWLFPLDRPAHFIIMFWISGLPADNNLGKAALRGAMKEETTSTLSGKRSGMWLRER